MSILLFPTIDIYCFDKNKIIILNQIGKEKETKK